MEIKTGTIVKSIAGHDGNRFYVVLHCDDSYCYIADGKSRKMKKPKRKNKLHLIATKDVFDCAKIDTDRKIRQMLWQYNYGDKADSTLRR